MNIFLSAGLKVQRWHFSRLDKHPVVGGVATQTFTQPRLLHLLEAQGLQQTEKEKENKREREA